ncbi:MAG: branched-chain amino acid ABC transporter ATP-binding protein/permease [Pseudolabrys sp.]|nr:branched-chain amino acid ABC transporter ATP-binding protein/permease [Pseudolabrys sp.]
MMNPKQTLLGLGCVILYLAAAAFVSNAYYQLILTNILIWATLAVAWNIFSGYTGLLSFGHAAFFGLGAFTLTLLLVTFGITPWIGLIAAIILPAIAAIVIGIPTFRLRGHYFALAMVAYPLILLQLFDWAGFQEVTLPLIRENAAWYMQFDSPYSYTLLASGLLMVAIICGCCVHYSRFGLVLRSIKQDEAATQASGIDPFWYKLTSFMLSAALSGGAGAIYVVTLKLTTPNEVFGLIVSSNPIVSAMLGGVGTVWGPIVGAAILVPLSELLSAKLADIVPGVNGLILGFVIVMVPIWMPDGITIAIKNIIRKRERSDTTSDAISGHLVELDVTPIVSTRETIIALRGISCRFASIQAVDNITADIYRGSITGFVGPNGAGKTTLFNIINGFASTTEGTIEILGLDVANKPTFARARMGLARTFQTPRIYPNLTVLENVWVGAVSRSGGHAGERDATRFALQMADLAAIANKSAASLTAGEIRRIELARALASRPVILLLDETLAGLSTSEVDHMVRIIKRARDCGITILLIEHTMSALLQLVDRLIVLDRGSIIGDGIPSEVISHAGVIKAYLGSKWEAYA